jgi:exodeoxyribonuclease VII small subunit
MPAPKSRQKSPPFEELYKQLEEKVSLLEQGGLSLDDSLAAYEQAILLAQSCQKLLDSAELRITRLKETLDGPAVYSASDISDVDDGFEEEDDEEP